jgi:hypothetical protein
MTGRIAAMSIDGTPVSESDAARMQVEEEMHAEWRRRTVRVIAAAARDVNDCRMLISILGLDGDVEQARAEKSGQRSKRRRSHAAA